MDRNISSDLFAQKIRLAIDMLRSHELFEAYKLILESININPSAPQPHNLLGIWFEIKGDDDKARKHYRAADALDPTYKSASLNLDRICHVFRYGQPLYDFGDELEAEITTENEKNLLIL